MPHMCSNALRCVFGGTESRLCNRMFSAVPIRLNAALRALDAADHLEQASCGNDQAVAGIGSRVRFFERATAEFGSIVLVRPGASTGAPADVPAGAPGIGSRISILSPLGAALLGSRIGDSVDVTLHGCTARLLILNVAREPGVGATRPLRWLRSEAANDRAHRVRSVTE